MLELYKFDNDLNLLWSKKLTEGSVASADLTLYDDRIMIMGSLYFSVYNSMLDFDGNLIWENLHSKPNHNYSIRNADKLENGYVVLSGSIIHEDSLQSNAYLSKITQN